MSMTSRALSRVSSCSTADVHDAVAALLYAPFIGNPSGTEEENARMGCDGVEWRGLIAIAER
ncbi:hypothetical protein ACRPHP_06530 [Pantoea allii]|uniref:hypothetical protein n=1 Tax=Pantoea allii TaxID=574096 RepID=UPI003D7C0564